MGILDELVEIAVLVKEIREDVDKLRRDVDDGKKEAKPAAGNGETPAGGWVDEPREGPPRHETAWRPREDRIVRGMWEEGFSDEQIAEWVGRSETAVAIRRVRIGATRRGHKHA